MNKLYIALCIIAIILACACAYAADDEKPKDEGFISSSVDAVFNKVGQYTSGEKTIFLTEEELNKDETKNESAAGDTDILGRKIKEPDLKPLNTSGADKK